MWDMWDTLLVFPDSIGHTVTIGLRRAGETKQVSLTIAERPAA